MNKHDIEQIATYLRKLHQLDEPKGSPEDIAIENIISKVTDDPQKRYAIIATIRGYAFNRYSLKEAIEELEELGIIIE